MIVKLKGRKVLITCGPTREYLDPVRYMSNASTGEMGFSLAKAAKAMGAQVTVIAGPTEFKAPAGIKIVPIISALEMYRETMREASNADLIIGAAAVSDWRFQNISKSKVKRSKEPTSLTLIANPDIMKAVSAKKKPGQVSVGFALETDHANQYAKEKLRDKKLDMIVANGPKTLGSHRIKATLIDKNGRRLKIKKNKIDAAKKIIAEAAKFL